MQNVQLSQQLQRIHYLITQSQAATQGSFELQAHWGRYLCVLVAGFLENAIVLLYSDLAVSMGPEPLARFATSKLQGIRNPKAKAFIDTTRSFKDEWASRLEEFMATKGRREAIDAIMNNRHLIAHGKNSDITIVRVKEYLSLSVEVLCFIESQCR